MMVAWSGNAVIGTQPLIGPAETGRVKSASTHARR